jgi:hypothetical protein
MWIAALLFAISFAWLFPQEILNKKNMLIGLLIILFSTSSWYGVSEVNFNFINFSEIIQHPDFPVAADPYLVNPDAIQKHSYHVLPAMNIQDSIKYCHQEKAITKCHFPVARKAVLIELPILYYPKLLRITLNRKKVQYQGIPYENTLLAAIVSIPNKASDIEVTFPGWPTANAISWFGWGVWLLLWVLVLYDKFSRGAALRK